MDDLQQAVAKLRALSPRLNNAVDQAHRVVTQIEEFLVHECQVGVQADVPVIYNDKGVAITLLRYGRVEGKFRIALTNTDGDARFITRPWVDCDRSEKLASFPGLPKLLMAITKALEQQISATTTTSNTVSQLLSALGNEEKEEAERPAVDGEPRLTLVMRSEEALAAQAASKPVIRPRALPNPPKSNPDGEARRTLRKDDAKVG